MSRASRPVCAVWSAFQNIDSVTDLLGQETAARLRDRAQAELAKLGTTITLGDEFATVAEGQVGGVADRLRPISWLAYIFVGVTEVWKLRSNDAWIGGEVPHRLLELSAGLRFGVVSLTEGNVQADFDKAKDVAREQMSAKRGTTRFGFPPLWPGRFHTLTQISDRQCPTCEQAVPEILSETNGVALERCTGCQREWERHIRLQIGGRDVSECVRGL